MQERVIFKSKQIYNEKFIIDWDILIKSLTCCWLWNIWICIKKYFWLRRHYFEQNSSYISRKGQFIWMQNWAFVSLYHGIKKEHTHKKKANRHNFLPKNDERKNQTTSQQDSYPQPSVERCHHTQYLPTVHFRHFFFPLENLPFFFSLSQKGTISRKETWVPTKDGGRLFFTEPSS